MAEIILNVTTTQDENDGSELIGEGLSLREAILIANTDPNNEYTINLPAGLYNLTIKNVLSPPTDTSVDQDNLFRSRLSTGDLDITGNVTIIGDNPENTIINAGTLDDDLSSIGDRVFDVLSSARSLQPTNGNLTLKNVTIQNGIITEENIDATYQDGTLNGGALNIDVGATATIINSIVENSRTVTSQGGGINNSGTLTLDRTIVRGNNSGDNAGGIYNDQNAILSIYNSAIINNLADAGNPDIIEGGGGGVLNEINATLTMVNTTVSGNRSVSGANQTGDGGGGILSRGITRIINSTIVNNFAQVGSGIYSETTEANTILYNTIVGNNEGSPDIDGFFDDRSAYNLISNGNGQGILDKVNFNIVGGVGTEIIDLKIGDLQFEPNGVGKTPYHPLEEGSLAIDNGNNEINGTLLEEIELYFPPDNLINGEATDQRLTKTIETTREEITYINGDPLIKITTTTTNTGFQRKVDGRGDGRVFVDIGAYEFGAEEITETVVTIEYQDLEGNIIDDPDLGDGDGSDGDGSDGDGSDGDGNGGIDNEGDGNGTDNDSLLNTPLFRWQNSDLQGTYLYANAEESLSIEASFPNFINEGFAFNVSDTPDDELIAMYRFQNEEIPGTYLYVGEEERDDILTNYQNFELEGLAFYVYGADADKGTDIFRLQNTDLPGTYLFVAEEEKNSILANYSNFIEEGVAFEATF